MKTEEWILVATVVAATGAIATWWTILLSYREQRLRTGVSLRRSWNDARDNSWVFWDWLKPAYSAFAKKVEGAPLELRELALAAGAPPSTPMPEGQYMRDWLSQHGEGLKGEQRIARDFACTIYASDTCRYAKVELQRELRGTNDKDDENANKQKKKAFDNFDAARRAYATFFDDSQQDIDNKRLAALTQHAYPGIVLLGWLEIALAQRVRHANRGKVGLFGYLNYLEKRLGHSPK